MPLIQSSVARSRSSAAGRVRLDPGAPGPIRREAHMLASLNHAGVAAVYGSRNQRRQGALVMELVEGEDLSERIARGRFPW